MPRSQEDKVRVDEAVEDLAQRTQHCLRVMTVATDKLNAHHTPEEIKAAYKRVEDAYAVPVIDGSQRNWVPKNDEEASLFRNAYTQVINEEPTEDPDQCIRIISAANTMLLNIMSLDVHKQGLTFEERLRYLRRTNDLEYTPLVAEGEVVETSPPTARYVEPPPIMPSADGTLISETDIQSFMSAPHTMIGLTFTTEVGEIDPDYDLFTFRVLGYYENDDGESELSKGLVFIVRYVGCVQEEIDSVEMEELLKDCYRAA